MKDFVLFLKSLTFSKNNDTLYKYKSYELLPLFKSAWSRGKTLACHTDFRSSSHALASHFLLGLSTFMHFMVVWVPRGSSPGQKRVFYLALPRS